MGRREYGFLGKWLSGGEGDAKVGESPEENKPHFSRRWLAVGYCVGGWSRVCACKVKVWYIWSKVLST